MYVLDQTPQEEEYRNGYKSFYVQRLSDGAIQSVQAVDFAGNSIPLDPKTYIDREVQSPIDELPDLENYQKFK